MYLQPFDRHPADVAALRQCASDLLARSVEAADNAQATRSAYQPAIANWDGMGAAEMVSAAEPVQGEAQALGRDLAWGAVTGQYWATQVEGFNAQVEAITAGLDGQARGDYGATGTDGKPPTTGQIDQARAAANAAARQQWMQAHAVWIEDGRARGSAMLRDGPTEAHLLELREAGVLPGDGFSPLPDIWGAARNLVLPPAVLGSLGIPALAANWGLTGLGGLSTFMTRVKYGQFSAPGQYRAGRLLSRHNRFVTGMRNRNWGPRTGNSAGYGKWTRIGQGVKVGNFAVAAGTSAYEQWSRDSSRSDLSTSEKAGRAGTRGTFVGVGAAAGAATGAKVGVAAGLAIGGPVGAAVGGVAGGIVGGVIGSGVGNEVADHFVDVGGEAAEGATNVAKDVGSGLNPFD